MNDLEIVRKATDALEGMIESIRVCRVTHTIRATVTQRPECTCDDPEECECEAAAFGSWDEMMDVDLVPAHAGGEEQPK